jgi:hypothetical protein
MASDRESSASLIDLAAVVVSPALVMLMVGSLTFFLITVLYQGVFSFRLLWTMFFFVFGAVLIARLSIQFGRKYAGLYAAGLGAACFVALMAYVEYPGPMRVFGPLVNLLLMALIWWSADKLTWDCTHFDEDRKASGQGVLAAAGLDDAPPPGDEGEATPEPPRRGKKRPVGWLEKFQAYREAQRKKAHTPGVWVLYFSLAALPLFALGQSLIDPNDADTRRATFLQMAVYVGSGLGLLVTTTLMGLKRYLEQRGARIPPVMVGGWLGLGAGLIVVFLAVGAVLPRPHSETPWFGIKRAGKSHRDASRYAVIKDGSAGKGEGAAGKKTQAGDGKNSAKGGQQGGGNSGEKGSGGGQGKSQGGSQPSKGEKGNNSGKQSGQGQDQSKDDSQRKDQSGDQRNQDRGRNSRSDSKSSDKDQGNDDRQASRDGEETRDADENKSDDGTDSGSSSSGPSRLTEALEKVGSFVKWIVWGVVAVAVLVGVAVFVLKYLAPFTDWARNLLDWLKGLFARKPREEREAEEEAAAEEAVARPPPFSAFSNPFTDGTARRRAPAELVEYTFAALDAWAWDRDRGRQPGETPLEFAVRIGHEYAELDEPGFRLANLYARVLYSRSPLPADTLKALAEFWNQLEATPAGSA